MLNVFETGDGSFRLASQRDEDVGWIRGDALGFGGIPTEADAIAAAVAGNQALTGYLERTLGASYPAPPTTGRVKLVHDGAYEWVARGAVPLARLYRPVGDTRPGFGVEFVLRSYVKEGALISLAQIIHHAITRQDAPSRSTGDGIATAHSGPVGVR